MLSHSPEIPEGVPMTELEKRLARRIHNQRRRLAQLEKFQTDRMWTDKIRKAYIRLLQKRNWK